MVTEGCKRSARSPWAALSFPPSTQRRPGVPVAPTAWAIADLARMNLMPMQSTAAGHQPGAPPPAGLRAAILRGSSPGAVARRHWLLTVLLVAGLALRVLAQLAHRPA